MSQAHLGSNTMRSGFMLVQQKLLSSKASAAARDLEGLALFRALRIQ